MGNNTRDYGTWEVTGIYKDEGCSLHPTCLTCPFPDCVYESATKLKRILVYPFITLPISRNELARKAGIGVKAAQIHLARYKQVNGDFNEFIGVEDVS